MNNEPSDTIITVRPDRSGALCSALRLLPGPEPHVPAALATLLDRISSARSEFRGGEPRATGALSAFKEKIMPRELIDTGTDKRFVRRDKGGKFSESDDVGRSLTQDQKKDSSTKPKKGEGDRGDR